MTTTLDRQFRTTPATDTAWSAMTPGSNGPLRRDPLVGRPSQFAPDRFDEPLPRGPVAPEQTVPPVTPPRKGIRVDQGRYWVGVLLTSAVAAMAGVIGIVIAQDLLKVGLSMASIGLAGAGAVSYAMVAVMITLLAALAYDGMLMFAPRPTVYYCWLAGLLTTLAVLLPFTAPIALGSQAALAVINLVVGLAVITLIPVAATNARA